MMKKKLMITLEDGQKAEGTVRSFSEYSHKDEKQFAGITMTYNIFLPVSHPMFKKLYVPDQFILEEIAERNVLAFVIEVTRGFTLSQEKFNDLSNYEEITIHDTLPNGAYVWGTFAYVTNDYEVVECDETVLMHKISEIIRKYEEDAWRVTISKKPFTFAVPHITKMAFIKE